jgi:hypothetical protein
VLVGNRPGHTAEPGSDCQARSGCRSTVSGVIPVSAASKSDYPV